MPIILTKIWKIVSHPLVYATLISIISGISTYFLALRKFHRKKQYQNKLDRYLVMVNKMRGFVEGTDNPEDRVKFVNSYRTIWLYGSAKVIKLITKFLKLALPKDENRPKNQQEETESKTKMKNYLKEAVLERRKDLKARGKLKKEDFDIFV